MSSIDNATAFFHACEGLYGWEGCKVYVAEGAAVSAQSDPLVDITTVAEYCDWMAGLGNGPLQGCGYVINASAYDEQNNTALFFGTLTGQHTGEGGPVPATGKTAKADYVYSLTMNDEGKVVRMVKVWNAPWTLVELGWV